MKAWMVLGLFLVLSPLDAEGHGKHPRAYVAFQASLSPHGEWIHYDRGLYVWRPHQVWGDYWQPYTVGRWVWTIDGWYWESDEPWGWATYHYGRWAYDDFYGWVWIPDLEWGPAWVEWRTGTSCLGWAPLGPHNLVHFSWGYWGYRAVPVNHWVFVDYRNLTSTKIQKHLLSVRDRRKHFDQTKEIQRSDRRTFGPDRGEVERRGKIRVSETRVRKETPETRKGSSRSSPEAVDGGRVRTPGTPRVNESAPREITRQPRVAERSGRSVREPERKESDPQVSGRSQTERIPMNQERSRVSPRVQQESNESGRTTQSGRTVQRVLPQE
jgi:hypothetical protein